MGWWRWPFFSLRLGCHLGSATMRTAKDFMHIKKCGTACYMAPAPGRVGSQISPWSFDGWRGQLNGRWLSRHCDSPWFAQLSVERLTLIFKPLPSTAMCQPPAIMAIVACCWTSSTIIIHHWPLITWIKLFLWGSWHGNFQLSNLRHWGDRDMVH